MVCRLAPCQTGTPRGHLAGTGAREGLHSSRRSWGHQLSTAATLPGVLGPSGSGIAVSVPAYEHTLRASCLRATTYAELAYAHSLRAGCLRATAYAAHAYAHSLRACCLRAEVPYAVASYAHCLRQRNLRRVRRSPRPKCECTQPILKHEEPAQELTPSLRALCLREARARKLWS